MNKKIKTFVKIQVPAGSANPSPPVGPALGQKGVNIIEFCKLFNEQTKNMEKGLSIPVIVTVYSDRTFSFIIKSPPASVLLKKSIGITSGSGKTKIDTVGKINKKQINEIVKIKFNDMTGANVEAMSRSIIGTANSMGIILVEDK